MRRLNRPQNIQRVSRWRWVGSRVHTRSSARALNFGRSYITPLLVVPQSANQQARMRTADARHSSIGCHHVVLPNQRAVTERWASARDLTIPAYRAKALCVNKLFPTTGVFGHRAILIFGVIETRLAEVTCRTPSSTSLLSTNFKRYTF